jgi:hypothetical protein
MDLKDYELRADGEATPPEPGSSRPRVGIVLALLLVVAALGAGYWYLLRPSATPVSQAPAATSAPAAGAPPAPSPLGTEAEPVEVPPLDESDGVVRDLVRQLSTHPRVLAWLATDGLIRNFAVVVENVASGQTPARHLQVLRPSAPFATTGSDTDIRIDSASYDRYSPIADAVASVDAQAAARVYTTLKPRLDEAHREFGPEPFDRTLERAIVRLLDTPIPGGNEQVLPKGAGAYQFADPQLEGLSPAQKLLLRMGPRNARIVQDKLREIAHALGIPDERLPHR